VLPNLPFKPLDVLCGPITQRFSDVPSRPLAQLAVLPFIERALALYRLADIRYALLDQRARGPEPGLSPLHHPPARKDIPPRSARGHLKLEVARTIDELEHRMRRIVAWAIAKFVDARVAAWTGCVARCERGEEFGCEGGRGEESCGFFPGGVCAFLTERDDLNK
jgi:hypothetical protein